jgi:hypothetical protein
MIFLIIFVVLAQSQPKAGPYDGYVANRSAIKANAAFVYTAGSLDRREIGGGRLWEPGDHGIVPSPVHTVIGRYECDGEVEHSVCGPSPEAAALLSRPAKAGDAVPGFPAIEMLFDGQTVAYHLLEENPFVLHVENREDKGLLGYSPFHFLQERFDDIRNRLYRNQEPRIVNAVRGGHPCKVEIYRNERPDTWNELQVCYDPSIGFLPRFIRFMTWNATGPLQGNAVVSESYLSDAYACASGGFLPTEWINVMFIIKNFRSEYKGYNEETVLKPDESQVSAKRFKATQVTDRKSPVHLDELDGLVGLSGIGGRVLVNDKPRTMSLREAKSRLGVKFSQRSGIVLPDIDQSELHEFATTPRRGKWMAWLIAAIILTTVVILFRLRKRKQSMGAVAILACVLQTMGCSKRNQGEVHVLAAFDKTRVVYPAQKPVLSLNLILRNEGNGALRIFSVTGGCSCRKVKETSLPQLVYPGNNIRLPVEIHSQDNFSDMTYSFHVESDHGPINVAAKLFAIPDHVFSPKSISLGGIVEDQEPTFEIVHREVFGNESGRSEATVRFPTRLRSKKMSTRQGKVGGAPDLSFVETHYRVSVNESSLGLHRETITLGGDAHNTSFFEVPVVWERVRYLSAVPQRVVLGSVPVRVFLRCPDESIELTQVLKAPVGVKAVVSSTRELVVSLDAKAPEIIDGRIEVDTTARDRRPLQVPVVRYNSTD